MVAAIRAASAISGSADVSWRINAATSAFDGECGLRRTSFGRLASLAGLWSIRPCLRARSSPRDSTVPARRTHATLRPSRSTRNIDSMSDQPNVDRRMSPNTRPSGSTAEHIVLRAERVVTTVFGASSITPASASATYSSSAARTVRAVVPGRGRRPS